MACMDSAVERHSGQRESVSKVALIPQCVECLERWLPGDEERWRAYLDTDGELAFYRPKCAQHEFGS
jgi:hypothetical protein